MTGPGGKRAVQLALGLGLAAAAPAATTDWAPLAPGQVQVGGEIGRRVAVTVESNLLTLAVDKDFLPPFREQPRRGAYIGLGKLIDASVRFAALTGDARVQALKDHLVSEALAMQEADGYLGTLPPERRIWTLWDVHEMSQIVNGLASDHRFFHAEKSLAAARRLADYLIANWTAQPGREVGGGTITVHMAVTGVENTMLALYDETGDRRYLDFVSGFRRTAEWDGRIVTGRWGPIGGHVYAHLCRCLGQLRLDRVQPDPRLWQPSRDALDFMLRGDGMTIPGECGDHECWQNTQEGTINLGETCATAYLVRWLDELLRREGRSLYGDIMERVVFNGLFAAQSPDGRRIRYYTPFDGPRAYHNGDTYCCPNNYRRIIAELPGMIYYLPGDGIAVNLYAPSEARTPFGVIRQETDYPNSGHVVIGLNPAQPVAFALRLRLPRWCAQPSVAVNGEAAAAPPGDFCVIRRVWQAGDKVELELPMPVRLVKGRVAQAGRVAVMRGPQVYCLNRARHAELAGLDLRLLVMDPASLEGPLPDGSVRAGGQACRLRAWKPGAWYPASKPALQLELGEFPDPGGEAIYFKIPNPNDPRCVEDELVQPPQAKGNTP